jgi:hypothetical protein
VKVTGRPRDNRLAATGCLCRSASTLSYPITIQSSAASMEAGRVGSESILSLPSSVRKSCTDLAIFQVPRHHPAPPSPIAPLPHSSSPRLAVNHIMSGLRILVPVKRVIDYAVRLSNSLPSTTKQPVRVSHVPILVRTLRSQFNATSPNALVVLISPH